MGIEGVDFERGGVGVRVEEREDGEVVEGGVMRELADGVNVFGLWESVDLRYVSESCACGYGCDCHCWGVFFFNLINLISFLNDFF